jgi:hypothetical protein
MEVEEDSTENSLLMKQRNHHPKKQTPKSTHPQITNKHPSHARILNNILPFQG